MLSDRCSPSAGPSPKAKPRPRRSARPQSTRTSPEPPHSGDAPRARQPRKPFTNGVQKRRPYSVAPGRDGRAPRSGASTPRARRGVQVPSPTREALSRARAEAALSAGRGRRVAIMDVILDAQAPTARLDADDLLDAVAAHQRAALGGPPDADEAYLVDLFVPGRHAAREAAVWRELVDAAAQGDLSPRRIYRVSAERSTAMWDGALESDGSERSEPI